MVFDGSLSWLFIWTSQESQTELIELIQISCSGTRQFHISEITRVMDYTQCMLNLLSGIPQEFHVLITSD